MCFDQNILNLLNQSEIIVCSVTTYHVYQYYGQLMVDDDLIYMLTNHRFFIFDQLKTLKHTIELCDIVAITKCLKKDPHDYHTRLASLSFVVHTKDEDFLSTCDFREEFIDNFK